MGYRLEDLPPAYQEQARRQLGAVAAGRAPEQTTRRPSGLLSASRMSEKQFMRRIIDLAKLRNWLCYHTHDSRHSEPGYPDLTLVRPPRLIVAEVKTERGRLRPMQRLWLDYLRECEGVETHLWRPSDWGVIEEILK